MGYWGEYPPTHLLARALIPAFGGVGAGRDGGAGAGETAGHGGHSDAEMDAFFAALGDAAPMGPAPGGGG